MNEARAAGGQEWRKFVKNQFPIMFEKGKNTKGKLFLKMGFKAKLKGGP